MEEEITVEFDGTEYSATYRVCGDTLTVYLPNGEHRETELRGLSPEGAARVHLRSYINSFTQSKR